jgi:hypothetical protein
VKDYENVEVFVVDFLGSTSVSLEGCDLQIELIELI